MRTSRFLAIFLENNVGCTRCTGSPLPCEKYLVVDMTSAHPPLLIYANLDAMTLCGNWTTSREHALRFLDERAGNCQLFNWWWIRGQYESSFSLNTKGYADSRSRHINAEEEREVRAALERLS